MAITPTLCGTATLKSAGTTLIISDADVPAGDMLVVVVAFGTDDAPSSVEWGSYNLVKMIESIDVPKSSGAAVFATRHVCGPAEHDVNIEWDSSFEAKMAVAFSIPGPRLDNEMETSLNSNTSSPSFGPTGQLKELDELVLKTKNYLKNFRPHENKSNNEKVGKQFVLIPPKKPLIRHFIKAVENTQKNIDVSSSWNRMKSAAFMLAEPLQRAWSRGVKGRVIIDETEESLVGYLKKYWKSPSAEIRQVSFSAKAAMIIHDQKEVFVIVEPETNFAECPALWSNNPCVVNIALGYFETLWNKQSQISHNKRAPIKPYQKTCLARLNLI